MHINNKIISVNSIIGRTRYFLGTDVLMTIYKGLIIPYILYNKVIIIKCTKFLKKMLQNSLLHTESIINNCLIKYCGRNDFILEDYINYYIMLFIFKNLYNDGQYLKDLLILENPRLNNLKRYHFKRKVAEKTIVYFGPQLWNSFSKELKHTIKLNEFKKLLINECRNKNK